MRIGRVMYLLGRVVSIVGLSMLLPLICAIIYKGPDIWVFALCAPATFLCGLLLSLIFCSYKKQRIRLRESFFFVTLSWVVSGLFGAIPYILAGSFPDLASAIFESYSGFTTTGASAMVNIEIMPQSILLWRSLTQWLGGTGIVLLFISLLQKDSVDGEGVSLFKAEVSRAALAERVAPRIRDNATAIFYVYLSLTAGCYISLLLAGMDNFDAINHALTTMATGGFSTKNLSIASFNNPAVEWIIAIFLFFASLNFALYYLFFVRRRFKKVMADQELRCFTIIIVLFTALVVWTISRSFYGEESLGYSIRQGFFQVMTIISTGGFATADFDQWPSVARFVLFILMFVGGCAGSTAGAIKMNRWYLATADTRRELTSVFRPFEVKKIYYNGRPVSGNILRSITHYFYMYFGLIFLGTLLVALTGVDWLEAFFGSVSSIGNVGPAIGSLGPAGNYALVPPFAKYVLSFLMVAGRLELYTVLVLLIPDIWKK